MPCHVKDDGRKGGAEGQGVLKSLAVGMHSPAWKKQSYALQATPAAVNTLLKVSQADDTDVH